MVPVLGRLIAGDAAAYTYLPASSAAFAEPEQLADELRKLGMLDVTVTRLGFGAVAIIRARAA
jgi:demethylmenaquinone methyltransferase/2-methoxy-6-polyprenyl-1,4-benzoquinol methylase